MDVQLVWAFDEPRAGLNGLMPLTKADAADACLVVLERMLTGIAGRYSYARTEVRALMPPWRASTSHRSVSSGPRNRCSNS